MMTRRALIGSMGAAMAAPAQKTKRRNVIFILSDDHRYDAMGFMKAQEWLKTSNLDRLASEGAHFKNAFVTTALCSPSRVDSDRRVCSPAPHRRQQHRDPARDHLLSFIPAEGRL